jgi:hypothetical protein
MLLKRLGISILSFASLFSPARAQVVPPASAAQDSVTAKASPFTDQLRKTVVFLRVRFEKEGRVWDIKGTGFFVFYPDERLGGGRGFTYLVTNRHMAVPGAEEGHSYTVKQYYTRLNVKKQVQNADESESIELPLELAPGISWLFPADPSVDLAAVPVNPDNVSADYVAIPVSMIATKEIVEAKQIRAGDQVLFAGYFYQFPGDKRIQPIVRQGVLAMMPDERIGTTLKKLGTVYLADIHAFHGNSGSPIFVNTGGLRTGYVTASSYMLLGAVSGYYPESESNFSIPAARVLTGEVHDNSGVTVVVPGDEIKALLDLPALKLKRELRIEEFLRNK